MNLLISNKKGFGARNVFIAILMLFLIGLLSIYGTYFTNSIVDGYTAAVPGDQDIQDTGQKFKNGMNFFDNATLFILIALLIGAGITSYKLRSAAVGYALVVFMAVFFGIVSYYFNFLFQKMIEPSIFTTTLLQFPKTIFICQNLHWISLVMILIGSIILYGKTSQYQEFQT